MRVTNPLLLGVTSPLVGRDRDLEWVSGFLTHTDSGGALLLSGEPGVGKTALLDAVAKSAVDAGTRVLRAAGVQFEADVSYSALNQALLPLQDAFDTLDATHRDAIRVALGFGVGQPPNRLVVSNAALAVLQAASEEAESDVLVIVDDLPWVDRSSAAVFAFIARRLAGSRLRFLAAMRSGTAGFFESGGLPTYELPPLDTESATRLVDERFPNLARQVRQRLLTTAQGNPLALLELPNGLRAKQRRALETLPAVLPLSQRLQSMFVSRIQSLPAATQDLLLLATLEGSGDLGVLHAAARKLGGEGDLENLVPAERDQLLSVDEGTRRLVFRHPLIRSAVVEATTSNHRRAAHRALAQVLSDRTEARAWHLGESTFAPDEHVAALLEQAARHVLNRGDAVAAIAALTRAADLSPRGPDRARRLEEAAYIGAEAMGALQSASQLLEDARRADPDYANSPHSAAAAAVQLLLNSDGNANTAHRLLAGAIEEGTHGYEAENAALVDALHLLLLLCNYGARAELWESFHTALSRMRPEPPELLSVAGSTFSDPARTEAATLRQLDRLVDGAVNETDPVRIVRIGIASIYPDRLAALREPSWRLVRQGREGGPVRRTLSGLLYLSLDDFHTGRWDEIVELADEGLELCAKTGYSFFSWYFHFTKGLVAAVRGDVETAHELAQGMTDWASPRGLRSVVQYAHQVHVLAYLATGDFEEAFRHAHAISPAGSLAPYAHHALWVFFELVEAAVRTRRRAEAVAHVRAVQKSSAETLSPRLALLAGGAAALVAEDDDVSADLFAKALSAPDVDLWPFDRARVQLAQGERLRRARATLESRGPLLSALRTFQQLGAGPWAERAAKELRAAGQSVANHEERGGAEELTPQEREIAELAASGLTNKQIAERLYISHRTVSAHLYRIYPKLGISSRTALRDALAARDTEPGERKP
ncbi:ATP-binding protein [Streptomyces canus]|uniref:ATP-binding protein n=1 Tax=Streptomyces canus TaxID=58343 RepID=UPI002786B849|nr:AAA family ATPase [Streptomyces canus]MDQ1071048.1 DNA-binding CsgD family transcriptional regulator/DNA polymerase III delta prime subunit [Streptomyces canus]